MIHTTTKAPHFSSQEMLFSIDENEKAFFSFILLDELGKELIGTAGEAGFEHSSSNLTIGDMAGGNTDGLRDKGLPGIVVKN